MPADAKTVPVAGYRQPVTPTSHARRRLRGRPPELRRGRPPRLAPGERLSLFGASGVGQDDLPRGDRRLGHVSKQRRIRLDGRARQRCARERRARALQERPVEPRERGVALVRQPTTLFPHLSVRRQRHLPRSGGERLVGGVPVERLLEEVGLGGLAGAAPDSLSGGQRQRACLARAIARPFRALLLDEPFSAVDAASRALLRRHRLDAVERGGSSRHTRDPRPRRSASLRPPARHHRRGPHAPTRQHRGAGAPTCHDAGGRAARLQELRPSRLGAALGAASRPLRRGSLARPGRRVREERSDPCRHSARAMPARSCCLRAKTAWLLVSLRSRSTLNHLRESATAGK